jgi:hypothetical protein
MSKKKSYMEHLKLINEGFFDKISSFLRKRPKLKNPREKKYIANKARKGVDKINRAIDDWEKDIKKVLGDDYPSIPRFKPEDFIK